MSNKSNQLQYSPTDKTMPRAKYTKPHNPKFYSSRNRNAKTSCNQNTHLMNNAGLPSRIHID
uniref:Uncharacterized protein n=1 Tax=Rhizophora mucronata TaxID=61149 RepID=A0A2P2P1D6_RHIMU